jgi:hypothetical protein
MAAFEKKGWPRSGHHNASSAISGQRSETGFTQRDVDCASQPVSAFWEKQAAMRKHRFLNGRSVIRLAIAHGTER